MFKRDILSLNLIHFVFYIILSTSGRSVIRKWVNWYFKKASFNINLFFIYSVVN